MCEQTPDMMGGGSVMERLADDSTQSQEGEKLSGSLTAGDA